MSKICLVILIGIPGVGKSHLCKYISQHFTDSNTIKISYISYDDFEKQSSINEYKILRNNIYKHVDNLLNNLTETINCILIDDNMYYRSMRRLYYNLAKKYSIGFCQIHVTCQIQTAIKRNNLRPIKNIIPEHIINKMSLKLEPPVVKNIWEKYSVEINSEKPFNQNDLTIITNLILEAMENPVRIELQQCSSAHINSFIHNVDLILRKLVGRELKEAIVTQRVGKESLEMLSKQLMCRKKLILDGLRHHELFLPEFGDETELEESLVELIASVEA